eukprot:7621588-Ditylum_brightwellii.AAC.1
MRTFEGVANPCLLLAVTKKQKAFCHLAKLVEEKVNVARKKKRMHCRLCDGSLKKMWRCVLIAWKGCARSASWGVMCVRKCGNAMTACLWMKKKLIQTLSGNVRNVIIWQKRWKR